MMVFLLLIFLPAAQAQELQENPYLPFWENQNRENPYQENPYWENQNHENPYWRNQNRENPFLENQDQKNLYRENQEQENPYQENPYEEIPYRKNPYQENQDVENKNQEIPYPVNPYKEYPYEEKEDVENPHLKNPYLENQDLQQNPDQVIPYQENHDQGNTFEENPRENHVYENNPYRENPYMENPHMENQDQEIPYQANQDQRIPYQENEDQKNSYEENPYQENQDHKEHPNQEIPYKENQDQEIPYQENQDQENPYREYPYQENQELEKNPYQETQDQENPYEENPYRGNQDQENPYEENPYRENQDHKENQDQENSYEENPYWENQDQENPYKENPYRENQDREENQDQENSYEENPYRETQDQENPYEENPYREKQDREENQDQENSYEENPYRENQDHEENQNQENPYDENPYPETQDQENPYEENPYRENQDHEENRGNRGNQENSYEENPYRENQDHEENKNQGNPYDENPYPETQDQENPYEENPYRENQDGEENQDQKNPYEENPYRENQDREETQDQENPYEENPYRENQDRKENQDQKNPYEENPYRENQDREETQDQENPYKENPYRENQDREDNQDPENSYEENPYRDTQDQENPHEENPYRENQDREENQDQENPYEENPYRENQDHEENQNQENPYEENPYGEIPYQENQDQCPDGSCNPQLGDLMVGRDAQLSSSSTCGSDGPQKYCMIGYLQEEKKCFTCDSRLPYHRHSNPTSHRIQNIITTFDPDSKMKWWQSENGVHEVSIRLDLETMFQLSHLILTFRSFRPAAMLVERSQDFGRSWKVLRFFSEDCSLHFPSVSTGAADSVDDVVCDSRYSGPEPSTDGEVVLKALDPIFEIENPYAPNIQDRTLLTNLRVNFTRLFTLGDTLLSRRRRNPENKYFYSVYNMVVQGRCFCHGHAQLCSPVGGRGDVFTQPGTVNGHCVCQHNTAGENCEQCQPFHHDSPWGPGGEESQDICRRCFCHGHSDSCHFDAARYRLTNGRSGGVCDNCRHHRGGPHCELCAPFFYQDPQRTMEDPLSCIPCDCEPSGVEGAAPCDAVSGRCICKENVEGQRCDRCKQGFYSLREDDPTGCQACRCHPLGSVGCDQVTGACQCEPQAFGAFCDRCVEGLWGLGGSGQRCSLCDCDIGGAHSNRCALEDGQCPCLPNMMGRRCSDPAHGYFLPSLDYFLYEAELAAPLPGSSPTPTTPPPSSSLLNLGLLPRCEQYYREQGFDFKVSNGRVVLVPRTRQRTRQKRQRRKQRRSIPLFPGLALQIIPRQRAADQPITWTGLGVVRAMEEAGLRFTVDNLPSSSNYRLVIAYESESPSDWLASVSIVTLSPGNRGCPDQPEGRKSVSLPGNRRLGILEAPLCLNAGAQYFVDVVLRSQSGPDNSHILIDSIALILSGETSDICSQDDVTVSRPFRCVGLAAPDSEESLLEVCEGIIRSLSAQIHNGAVACRCSPIGSLSPSCSKVGGVCECKANVIGHCCDHCAPLTFGLGPDGCTACACDPYGSLSDSCDPISGQCACRPEVSERRCDGCQRGFWGFPSCRRCECGGHSEDCDAESGECVNCRGHTYGNQCERCEEGYHGYPLCRPCLCPELLGSSRFFATSCQYDSQSLSLTCNCLEGHTGAGCDRCSTGYYGNLTVGGARCQECPCNNNVDPSDGSACDTVTGECLRCLHNTAGPRCQSCKPGYYGDALQQACTECTCDRRGTQVTACPLGSRCYCDPQTGSCPCRTGATGHQCDQCQDGYWNLNGASGCQPCSCDPANAESNVCDKVSGQCVCQTEFGGRQCDECGENHFGNPDLQCVSCDCNLEGTLRPACDPETGECWCRPGVSGIFCDECSPGRDSAFPECEECHPCRDLWSAQVLDILRAADKMITLIPGSAGATESPQHQQQQLMLRIHSELEEMQNISSLSQPGVDQLQKLFLKVIKMKDMIDPNIIIIDASSLLNTDMENIQQEFTKLLNQLKDKLLARPKETGSERVQELSEEIQKLHKSFLSNEQRLNNATRALEASMETRQNAKERLNTCSSRGGNLTTLEKNIQPLQVLPWNQKICGDPGLEDCSGCGGALCTLSPGKRKCGGPNCGGVLPLSRNVSEMTERAKEQLQNLPTRLLHFRNKLDEAKEVTKEAMAQTINLQDRLSNNAHDSERDKNQTKELIYRVRQYLMDDMVPPDDISSMAEAVLRMKLPRSQEQISSMMEEVRQLLTNAARFQDDLKNLKDRGQSSHKLLEEALRLRNRSKDIDIKDISRNLYEAERAQNQANDALEASSDDLDEANARIIDTNDRLTDIEDQLTKSPGDLLSEIRAVKTKEEENRRMAADAKDRGQTAIDTTTQTQGELAAVLKEYKDLKQKQQTQTGQSEAEKRLRDIVKEAEDVKDDVEERLRRIQELEQKMEHLEEQKKKKASEVSDLLKEAESLRQAIASQAESYVSCTS